MKGIDGALLLTEDGGELQHSGLLG